MKTNLLLALFAVLLSASSCSVNLGEGSERIEPSSNIVKNKYPMEAFDKVESHVVGNIQLVQSDQSRVTLSAPENYIDLFSINNDHGKLEINFAKDNINIDASNITIIVYTPTLHKVKNSGAADVRSDSLTTDELIIDMQSTICTEDEIKEAVSTCPQDIGSLVRVEKFDLEKVGNHGWMKIMSDGKIEFKTLNGDIYHQIVKHYHNLPITDDDLVFRYNGELARFLKEVGNPWG